MNSVSKELGVNSKAKEDNIKEKQKQSENLANAIYQNISTALDSIEEILKLSKDERLTKELKDEKLAYTVIKNDLLDLCLKINIKPKDNNIIEKARLWTSIKLTTLTDKSTRHLAEMMLIGTVMGNLTCYKDLCDHKGVDKNLYDLLNHLNILEEQNFNNLKNFLKEG